ncbi:MAG: ATP-grasp domain-containing protein [Nanoarchaeota archaeon]|nr:ATP-grasp domain-containing protein [Nanoarchaeota archaeon]
MNLALTCSIKPKIISKEEGEKYAEFDSIETINDLADAIKANNHDVEVIDVKEDIKEVLKNKKEDIDLVFNVAEGLVGNDREALVPKICEELNIPFTASGSVTLITTLDKAKTKQILEKNNIPTPKFQVFEDENQEADNLKFPLLVKPLLEGSSKGVFNENLVNNEHSLKKITKKIIKQYSQPAIVEEFINGREFTVSVIGYIDPIVLPIVEIKFDHLPEDIHPMDSYEAKWIHDNPKTADLVLKCPAELEKELKEQITKTALNTYKTLDCKDWSRIDVRLDKNNIPHILEVNALPGFMKDPIHNSRLPKAAYANGWTYEKLIGEVISSAIERYDLK